VAAILVRQIWSTHVFLKGSIAWNTKSSASIHLVALLELCHTVTDFDNYTRCIATDNDRPCRHQYSRSQEFFARDRCQFNVKMEEEGTDTGLRPETRDFTKICPFPGFGFSTVSTSVYSPPAFSTRTPFILSCVFSEDVE
jgi:hypothetical protein